MSKCELCGCEAVRQENVDEIFHVQDCYLLVEQIPAMVCRQCGEKTFSAETAESIRLILHDHRKPPRSVALEVFAFWPEQKLAS